MSSPWTDRNFRQGLPSAASRSRRGDHYNHSTYCDHILTGLVGLRPGPGDEVEVHPLLPAGTWNWFCLDRVKYHGRLLTILWDRTGRKYGRGSGLRCSPTAGSCAVRVD